MASRARGPQRGARRPIISAQSEWARCRPWIVAALAHSPGLETIEDVERLIGERVYQFWPGERSAAITEIVEFQRTRALMVRHAGGNMDELVSMCPSIEEFARAMGCMKIMGEGRSGWKRIFEGLGYRLAFITMEKDLT